MLQCLVDKWCATWRNTFIRYANRNMPNPASGADSEVVRVGVGVGGGSVEPPTPTLALLTQNFIFMGNLGKQSIWDTVFTPNIHTPYSLSYIHVYTSLPKVHFTTYERMQNCCMSGKQCRPWSDAAASGLDLHCLLRPFCPKSTVIWSNRIPPPPPPPPLRNHSGSAPAACSVAATEFLYTVFTLSIRTDLGVSND